MYQSSSIVMRASILLTLAAGLAAPGATKRPIVVTGPSTDVITRDVSYRDLNLASRRDERRFTIRVSETVNEVCDSLSPTGRVHIQTVCRTEAWRGVRPQIAQAVRRARQQMAGADQSATAMGAITLTFVR